MAFQGSPRPLVVEVFNVADCHSMEEFERYVPGIGSVYHTPVAGLWSDGKPVEKGTGKAARDLIARLFGEPIRELLG
jgi:hypothetical protein